VRKRGKEREREGKRGKEREMGREEEGKRVRNNISLVFSRASSTSRKHYQGFYGNESYMARCRT
jgi:hypothetical protein